MRQKGMVWKPHGLLISLAAFILANAAHAQVTHVDFQVINLPRNGGSEVHYLAVRNQDEWARVWQTGSIEPTLAGTPHPARTPRPLPKIDFSRFILLIASTGVKPSSGYKTIFVSVDTAAAAMTGAPSNKMATTVHVIEIEPGNCPVMAALTSSVSYALIPQTTNEIRFVVTRADRNCNAP